MTPTAPDDAIRAVGIIAEYNPFHNGHAYHIREAKRISKASYCIVAMSGDFVQRGEPAIYDKYTRTAMALRNGADLVVEIPPVFAVSSAEDFGACGVALLNRLGVVSHLCFGSEYDDVSRLRQVGQILAWEPAMYSRFLKESLSSGSSYPKARETALTRYLTATGEDPALVPVLLSALSSPNSTLGVEYCKAILRQQSSMIPVAVGRIDQGYHSQELAQGFSSATAIRRAVFQAYDGSSECTLNRLKGQVPADCLELMEQATPLCADDGSLLLTYRLLELHSQGISLDTFTDVSRELAARMEKQMLDFSSFSNRIEALKTKQYTYTRISRCLTHILLHITDDCLKRRRQAGYASYVRILGFRKESAPLLSTVKKASKLPLITKTADASNLLSDPVLSYFRHDLFCSHVYQSMVEQKSGRRPPNEYTRSVVIL